MFKRYIILISLMFLVIPAQAYLVDPYAMTRNAQFTPRYSGAALEYDDKFWYMGGRNATTFFNDVWYSQNGVDWVAATRNAAWEARERHTALVYDDKMWIIAGGNSSGEEYLMDVWYSINGVDWFAATRAAQFTRIEAHTSVVFDNKMWVMGGWNGGVPNNKIWNSTDGITWTEVTPYLLGWDVRERHTSVVFDNKIWIIGGIATVGKGDDVWYSEDGVFWFTSTTSAAFGERYAHTSFVLDNKMWVVGGIVNNTDQDDAWYSTDGATWVTTSLPPAGWYGDTRSYMSAITFTSRTSTQAPSVFLLGGMRDATTELYSDVWVAQIPPATATLTSTRTITPTVTPTITRTATRTVTQTVTEVLTGTPFPTATITQTITQTSTPQATATVTQTITPVSPDPVVLIFLAQSMCGFKDAVKLEWSGYPGVFSDYNAIVHVNDYTINLDASANLSRTKDRFVYIVPNLGYHITYNIWVEVTSSAWPGTLTSNIVTVQLRVTPTPTATH